MLWQNYTRTLSKIMRIVLIPNLCGPLQCQGLGPRIWSVLGGALKLKAFETYFLDKILLSPKRENTKCPKGLPSCRVQGSGLGFGVLAVQGFLVRGLGLCGDYHPYRPHGSSFLGLPYRILNMNPQQGTTMEPMGILPPKTVLQLQSCLKYNYSYNKPPWLFQRPSQVGLEFRVQGLPVDPKTYRFEGQTL